MAQNKSTRLLTLEGGCNFRDIGGYPTRGGRQTAWGKVFRTGVLSYLTDVDSAKLTPLGVRAICDLRRTEERHREPTRWPDPQARPLFWDDGAAPPTIRALAANHPNTAAGMRNAMCDLYRALPAWMAPRIRGLYECIANDDLPVIIHCAAGKDRTGVAIAVLLASLDVPNDTIIEDYLFTNHAGDFLEFILTRERADLGLAASHHPLLELPTDVRTVLFAADADYLQAALAKIDDEYGGVATYLRDVVGIAASTQHQIRERLLA
jgi:protein-tyrosine phosphatase